MPLSGLLRFDDIDVQSLSECLFKRPALVFDAPHLQLAVAPRDDLETGRLVVN